MGEEQGGDELKEQHWNIYTAICKTESRWEFAVWNRELNPVLCDNLEGWGGEGGGTEVQEGGNKCIPKADSHWCVAETNTML